LQKNINNQQLRKKFLPSKIYVMIAKAKSKGTKLAAILAEHFAENEFGQHKVLRYAYLRFMQSANHRLRVAGYRKQAATLVSVRISSRVARATESG
jgi:hypothetical protein